MKNFNSGLKKMSILILIFGINFIVLPPSFAGYSYAKEITATAVYDNMNYFKLEASIPETPIGIGGGGGSGSVFVGTMKNCNWAIASCNQDDVGFTPA